MSGCLGSKGSILTRRSWNASRLMSESFEAASLPQTLQRDRDRPE